MKLYDIKLLWPISATVLYTQFLQKDTFLLKMYDLRKIYTL